MSEGWAYIPPQRKPPSATAVLMVSLGVAALLLVCALCAGAGYVGWPIEPDNPPTAGP